MHAIRTGEIGSGRTNFDRGFITDPYSLQFQGSDITPSVDPIYPVDPVVRENWGNEYSTPIYNNYNNDDRCAVPVSRPGRNKKPKLGGHTVTFLFGLALIGIVVLGFYFGKKPSRL